MYREMRRAGQKLPTEEVQKILTQADTMTLALDDDGQPYAVPLNFVFSPSGTWGTIYFHCAQQGHKIDVLQKNARVSLCIVVEDCVIPETFSTRYRSVVAFGQARILYDEQEKKAALLLLTEKYCKDVHQTEIHEEISRSLSRTAVVSITIEHATGKHAHA